jgi:hypothetical protein
MGLDKTFNDFKLSFFDMPWLTVKFNNASIAKNVDKYEVKCIPTLIVFNNKG